jgi:hypothetical protein
MKMVLKYSFKAHQPVIPVIATLKNHVIHPAAGLTMMGD